MRRLLQALVGQERALANARTACTSLSRRRVEREDVELFLAAHAARTPGGTAATDRSA